MPDKTSQLGVILANIISGQIYIRYKYQDRKEFNPVYRKLILHLKIYF